MEQKNWGIKSRRGEWVRAWAGEKRDDVLILEPPSGPEPEMEKASEKLPTLLIPTRRAKDPIPPTQPEWAKSIKKLCQEHFKLRFQEIIEIYV